MADANFRGLSPETQTLQITKQKRGGGALHLTQSCNVAFIILLATSTSVSPNNLSLSMFAMKYKHRKVAILTLKELTRAMHAMAEQLLC